MQKPTQLKILKKFSEATFDPQQLSGKFHDDRLNRLDTNHVCHTYIHTHIHKAIAI
jgi:hypothetical protein